MAAVSGLAVVSGAARARRTPMAIGAGRRADPGARLVLVPGSLGAVQRRQLRLQVGDLRLDVTALTLAALLPHRASSVASRRAPASQDASFSKASSGA